MAVFKTKDESEGAFIVRALKDHCEQRAAEVQEAATRLAAVQAALHLAEQALRVAQDEQARG